jgi:hypothetical protein
MNFILIFAYCKYEDTFIYAQIFILTDLYVVFSFDSMSDYFSNCI